MHVIQNEGSAPSSNHQTDNIIERKRSMMTTDAFADWIAGLEHRSGTILKVIQHVDLEPLYFVNKIAQLGLDVVESNDGAVSIVQEQGDPLDFSRQSWQFPIHTDGLYHARIPDLVLLYCRDAGNGATPTAISDSRAVFKRPGRQLRMDLLQSLELVYVGKDGKEFPSPLVQSHPHAGYPILHLGHRAFIRAASTADRQKLRLSPRRGARIVEALREQMCAAMYIRHYWKAGDALLIDNHTFVHGREAESIDRQRKLLRIWLSVPKAKQL